MFITSLYDIDIRDDSFKTVFWIWWKSPIDTVMESETVSLNPQDRIEIVNAREFQKIKEYHDRFTDVKTGQEYNYTMAKFSATINHNWDITRFPFDRQKPEIIIESVEFNSDQLVYTKDTTESLLDEDIQLTGWTLPDPTVEIIPENKNYKTNFGFNNGDHNQQIYPRFTCSFTLQRKGKNIFFSYILGYIIAFALSLCICFLDVSALSFRMALAAIGLITSLAARLFTDLNLPVTSHLTLVSGIQYLTFSLIAMMIILSLAVYRLKHNIREKLAVRVNKIGGFLLNFIYVELLIMLIIFI